MMKRKVMLFVFVSLTTLWSHIFYQIESEGYLKNPHLTEYGIVCTDNYDSALYLIQDGKAAILTESPGVGRFFTMNSNQIGFKYIDKTTGLQAPALFDLSNSETIYLSEKSSQCSQVYFFESDIIFMLENRLTIIKDGEEVHYQMPFFSNTMAISPDGKIIALRNENEQIILFYPETKEIFPITDLGYSFFPLSWSPDTNYLLSKDIGEGLYLYQLSSGKVIDLEISGFANWIDSEQLLIIEKEVDISFLKTSLSTYSVSNKSRSKVRMDDEFTILDFSIHNETIFFTSLLDKSIYTATLHHNHLINLQREIQQKDSIRIHPMPKTEKRETKNLSIPYINQMYDTPQGYAHNYGACAAATAAMAIAYYHVFPHWNTYNPNPYPHYNQWGHYIGGTIYHYRGVTYDQSVYYSSGGVWCHNGIDNYHWYEGSPNSKMRGLIENHGLVSNQHWTSSCTYNRISADVANDYPYPICVTMTASGHLILAKGFYDDSRKLLYYHDPYGNKNTTPYLGYDGADVVYDWPGENNGYANLVSVAWSVTARSNHQEEAGLEIDVQQLAYGSSYEDYGYENIGFNLHTGGTLGMRYWRSELGGQNEMYWWTGAIGGTTDDYWASWRPKMLQSGIYEIEVYIPNESSVTTNANYKIYHSGGVDNVPVNQSLYGGQWVSLGEYHFHNDNSGYVYLGDAVGSRDASLTKENEVRVNKILYDAARFTIKVPDSPYLFFSDFEFNTGGLTANMDWEWGIDAIAGANSGEKVWGTVLNGNYQNRSDIYLDLNVLTGDNSMLSFYHWHQIEDVYRDIVFDGGNVKISTDGGASFEILYPTGGYPHIMRYSMHNPLSYEPCFSGETDGWEQVFCSLADYPNQNVIIRWHFGSDGATVDRGWYLDDVKVEELPLYLDIPEIEMILAENILQLIWNEIENAEIYHIYFCEEPFGTYEIQHSTTFTTYQVDNNLTYGFYYVIAATNASRVRDRLVYRRSWSKKYDPSFAERMLRD
jgi:hypothetical protein